MENYNAKGINLPKTKLGLAKMNKLINAAEKLFTTNGFHGTSISDICKEAGTAVGTFYIYFETKTDIYRYVEISKADKITSCRKHQGLQNSLRAGERGHKMLYQICYENSKRIRYYLGLPFN